MRRRRHRHRRSWIRQLRHAFRGVGALFIVALVGLVAIAWVVLPLVDKAYSLYTQIPDPATVADLERRAKAR